MSESESQKEKLIRYQQLEEASIKIFNAIVTNNYKFVGKELKIFNKYRQPENSLLVIMPAGLQCIISKFERENEMAETYGGLIIYLNRICTDPNLSKFFHETELEKAIEFSRGFNERNKMEALQYLLVSREDVLDYDKQKKDEYRLDTDEIVKVKVSEKELFDIITKIYGEEYFKEHKKELIPFILGRRSLLDKLRKEKLVTDEDMINSLMDAPASDREEMLGIKEKSDSKSLRLDLLKILPNEELTRLYLAGKISVKHIPIQKIAIDVVSPEEFEKYLFYSHETLTNNQTWNYYENGKLSKDYLVKKDFDMTSIVERYMRKIDNETSDTPVTADKLFEYFSPDKIIELNKKNESNKKSSKVVREFLRTDLRQIYEDRGLDLQRELIKFVKNNPEKLGVCDLLNDELVEIGKFQEGELTAGDVINAFNHNKSDDFLSNAYNVGFIDRENVWEVTDADDDKLFDFIENNGMNISVIEPSAQDIIQLHASGRISDDRLAEAEIDVDKIKEQYQQDKLKYEDIETLFELGFIEEATRDEIKNSYDLRTKLDELRKLGIIAFEDDSSKNPVPNPNPNPNPVPRPKKETQRVDSVLRNEFFDALGAEKAIFVHGDLFKGYKMIPLTDKKVGILEGEDGATYVTHIKMFIEYIEDIIGEEKDPNGYQKRPNALRDSSSRMDFRNNPKYVKVVNHTVNWGRNLIDRICEINGTLDARELRRENKDYLDLLEEDYRTKNDCAK